MTEREVECRAAADCLGYGEPIFWREPDRGLMYSDALVERLRELMRGDGVDLVYAPSPWEVHPDHRQACAIAMEAVKRHGAPARLAFYEVGVPLKPNVLLDIGAHWPTKLRAMRCFGSQLERQDYSRHTEALNVFRTYTLPADVKVAEAFRVITAAEAAQPDWLAVHGVQPHLGGVTATKAENRLAVEWPLVSVLIRSMNRPELARALDSVALQGYQFGGGGGGCLHGA